MSVQITIRDVPDAVKDELAARAALQGKSMQEYLRAEAAFDPLPFSVLIPSPE
jgi:plasmid stability protein